MKLKQLMTHVPVYQNVILIENLKQIFVGKVDNIPANLHSKTVGLIEVSDSALQVAVFDWRK